MKTEVTLALCVYNAEKYLYATLQSVLAQTYQEFHLLIVNDCSTDNSLSVIENFFREHSRQHEIISFDENKGIGYARYFAERHANTRYMMFLDADDILYPHAIETEYNKIISDNDLMAVGCYLEYIDTKGDKIGGGLFLGETTKQGFYEKAKACKRIFMQPTAIYDREIALSVGGYNIEGFPDGKPRYQDYCEDLDLWTRMSDLYVKGKAIVVVPEILAQYRKHEGMSSSTLPMILKMRYVKVNLLRRRVGMQELTFTDFYIAMPDKERVRLQRDADAAENLRNGVFFLRRKHWFKGCCLIIKSICSRPLYAWDKIRHNIKLK